MFVILLENTIISSLVFLLLIFKARISSAFMYRDNLLIIVVSSVLAYLMLNTVLSNNITTIMVANPIIVLILILLLMLFRFYRNPERKHNATARDLLAPADGFICYVRRIDAEEVPFSVKGKSISKISELSKVDILKAPCWLIGTTMTLFDVHYVRSPIRGKVVLNHYTKGKFLSLKNAESESKNERNTIVIENGQYKIGVIQIASKRVRGIRTYVRSSQHVEMGQRIGMITFGSQADVIFPANIKPAVKIGQWVYGGKTIIASLDGGSDFNEYHL
jgi:phosphatidylserine decarboxylase